MPEWKDHSTMAPWDHERLSEGIQWAPWSTKSFIVATMLELKTVGWADILQIPRCLRALLVLKKQWRPVVRFCARLTERVLYVGSVEASVNWMWHLNLSLSAATTKLLLRSFGDQLLLFPETYQIKHCVCGLFISAALHVGFTTTEISNNAFLSLLLYYSSQRETTQVAKPSEIYVLITFSAAWLVVDWMRTIIKRPPLHSSFVPFCPSHEWSRE